MLEHEMIWYNVVHCTHDWLYSLSIVCSLCVYPEMMRDLVDFYNVVTYTIVAVSAGIVFWYFTQTIAFVANNARKNSIDSIFDDGLSFLPRNAL